MIYGRFKWSQFPELDNCLDLENYMKLTMKNKNSNKKYRYNRAFQHNCFFHYTKLSNIEKIFGNHCFLLFNLGSSNDPLENKIENKDSIFTLCFSTGINENLPLWYLYSGVDGKGGCLCFTKSQIYSLIYEGEYFLAQVDDNKTIIDRIPIKLNEDFSCEIGDVVYMKKNGDFVDLKYNTMTNHNKISVEEFEKFKRNNPEFVKSLIWFYEKETRFVVRLTDKGKAKLKDNKKYAVILSFAKLPKTYEKIKLKLAPEACLQEITNEGKCIEKDAQKLESISKYPNIKKWIYATSNCSNSDYVGQIKMNLCGRCDKLKKVDGGK
ncbi:MAG: hypothetical protein ACI4XE_02920 [Acutalibacteraceae bacterium]